MLLNGYNLLSTLCVCLLFIQFLLTEISFKIDSMSRVNPTAVPQADDYNHATEPPQYYGMPPPSYDQSHPKHGGICSQTYTGALIVHSGTSMSPAVQNQVVVIDGGGVYQPVYYRAADSHVGPLVFSCFVIWCFNTLFGLIAFILAGKLNYCVVSSFVDLFCNKIRYVICNRWLSLS